MQNIIELYEWFDDYTKKLVGQLYYEGSLENGKEIRNVGKKIEGVQSTEIKSSNYGLG